MRKCLPLTVLPPTFVDALEPLTARALLIRETEQRMITGSAPEPHAQLKSAAFMSNYRAVDFSKLELRLLTQLGLPRRVAQLPAGVRLVTNQEVDFKTFSAYMAPHLKP